MSSFFHVNTGVRQGSVLAPAFFNTCMDWVLGRVVEQGHCGASVGNTEITDLVFADDAAFFAESLKVLRIGSRGTARGGEALGTQSFLRQDHGPGVWRHTG